MNRNLIEAHFGLIVSCQCNRLSSSLVLLHVSSSRGSIVEAVKLMSIFIALINGLVSSTSIYHFINLLIRGFHRDSASLHCCIHPAY